MIKDEFTEQEWRLIVSAPSLVGLAVSAASPSGPLGLVKELFAVGSSIAELGGQRSDNPLIRSVVEDLQRRAQEAFRADLEAIEGEPRRWAVGELARISRLLPSDDDSTDAAEFRRWLVAIADRVAEAAREGGFLGVGGDRVSEEEARALDEIRSALGVA